jgi:hypothetical protein
MLGDFVGIVFSPICFPHRLDVHHSLGLLLLLRMLIHPIDVLYILRHPPDPLAITYNPTQLASLSPNPPSQKRTSPPLTLPHNHTTHKHLNRAYPLERDFPLPRRLPQPQLMPQLLLAHRVRVIDLVAEDQEGDFGEVFHGEEGVELGFGFGQALVVFGVDEEDDAADFGEVVAPETAGWGGLAGGGGGGWVKGDMGRVPC